MALGCPGKSESRVVIGKCYDVSPDAIQKVLHRVKGAALSGSSGFISVGFSTFWGLFSLQSLTFRSKLYRPADCASYPVHRQSADQWFSVWDNLVSLFHRKPAQMDKASPCSDWDALPSIV